MEHTEFFLLKLPHEVNMVPEAENLRWHLNRLNIRFGPTSIMLEDIFTCRCCQILSFLLQQNRRIPVYCTGPNFTRWLRRSTFKSLLWTLAQFFHLHRAVGGKMYYRRRWQKAFGEEVEYDFYHNILSTITKQISFISPPPHYQAGMICSSRSTTSA